jgi:flagellar basal body-associated protein FliL
MADAEETKTKQKQEPNENQDTEKAEPKGKKSLLARIVPKIIILIVVAIFGGAGFMLSRLIAGLSTAAETEHAQSRRTANSSKAQAEEPEESDESWYYDLEPVIANLNVSDVTRYVKASLILEVSAAVDEKKGTAFLDEKKPVLTSWLTVYLASLGIDDIRGDANLKRIQSQVLDAFNEKLFPESKPKIKSILFKEFAVQ